MAPLQGTEPDLIDSTVIFSFSTWKHGTLPEDLLFFAIRVLLDSFFTWKGIKSNLIFPKTNDIR